jgi:hypothetical protein
MAVRRESINWRIAEADMVDCGFVTTDGLGGSGVLATTVLGNGSVADGGRGIGGGDFNLPAIRRIAAWRVGCGRFTCGRAPV